MNSLSMSCSRTESVCRSGPERKSLAGGIEKLEIVTLGADYGLKRTLGRTIRKPANGGATRAGLVPTTVVSPASPRRHSDSRSFCGDVGQPQEEVSAISRYQHRSPA